MRRRPWPIVLLAIFHILAPIGNTIINAYLQEMDVIPYLMAHLRPGNRLEAIIFYLLPPIAGLSIYACKKWSLATYVVTMIGILGYSRRSYLTNPPSQSLAPLLLFYAFNIALVVYFLIPAVRNIYLDPKIRWWEIAARYFCDFTVEFQVAQKPVTGKVLNISETGLFIRSKEIPRDQIALQIHLLKGETKVPLTGQVIYHHRQDEIGFALKFEHTPDSRREVKNIIQDLRRDGRAMARGQLGFDDSFKTWFLKLFKSGKGIVPEVNGVDANKSNS